MRGGAPLFELSDGVCRRETRAGLIPQARRLLYVEPAAEGANEAYGPLSAAWVDHSQR
jgi:hypothetical protein